MSENQSGLGACRNAKVGLITLGQTPRRDLMDALRTIAPTVSFTMKGALDGLSQTEIAGLQKGGADYPLMVRLSDGTILEVDMTRLYPWILRQARELCEANVQFSILLCSAAFPEFAVETPLIRPVALLLALAGILAPRKRVGIVSPILSQQEPAGAFWKQQGFTVLPAFASPYEPGKVCAAAGQAAEKDPDILILDCMSYSAETLVQAQKAVSCPVLLPQRVMQSFLTMMSFRGDVTF